jgi:hypothetical protein
MAEREGAYSLGESGAIPLTEVLQAAVGARFLTALSASRRLTASTGVPAKCWLRRYPLNLSGSCQRRECSMSKSAVLLCGRGEASITVPSSRRRVRWVP